jgi:hypothetical protein
MFRQPCLPPARSLNPLVRVVRALWTLPTNLVGHALGWLVTRARPERIGGPAAWASLYRLRSAPLSRALGAIAIGNVILAEDQFVSGARGRWVLAHELSHTRQHAWLGPLYLPVHLVLQIISVAASLFRPVANFPAQHAYNPLERLILYVPFDVLVDPVPIAGRERDRIWEAFGVVGDGD